MRFTFVMTKSTLTGRVKQSYIYACYMGARLAGDNPPAEVDASYLSPGGGLINQFSLGEIRRGARAVRDDTGLTATEAAGGLCPLSSLLGLG